MNKLYFNRNMHICKYMLMDVQFFDACSGAWRHENRVLVVLILGESVDTQWILIFRIDLVYE